ncbi:DNA polymerase family X lyase domain protein [Vibrio phage 1.031.O._10N.261.46.F8]|nr:DNA polymerase family X lyase domain protein [Vibrio phage 1.031.O._10N.261.46.F8]
MTIKNDMRTFPIYEVKIMVDYLKYLGEVYASTDVPNRHWKSMAMYKAANTLASAATDISENRTPLGMFTSFKNIGAVILEAIDELIENDWLRNTEKVKNLSMKLSDNKVLRDHIGFIVNDIKSLVAKHDKSDESRLRVCGSYRRKEAVAIGGLDFVATVDPRVITKAMEELGATYKHGNSQKLRFEHLGLPVNFYCTLDEYYNAHLLHYTGPAALTIQMRMRAKGLNMELNEYGLTKNGERLLDGDAPESEYFKFLQLEDPRNLA